MSFKQYVKQTESFGISLSAITNKEVAAAVALQQEEALKSRQGDLVGALRAICQADGAHGVTIGEHKTSIRNYEKHIKAEGAKRDRNRIIHALFVSDSDDITPAIRFGCYMIVHASYDMGPKEAEVLTEALSVEAPPITVHAVDAYQAPADMQKKRDTWVDEVFVKAEKLLPEGVLAALRAGTK
tara:strand:- start:32028 stop:32579 length:552 start_codon:yes stop_codon:yes gene_type:complete